MSDATAEMLEGEVKTLTARVEELKHLILKAQNTRCKCPGDHSLYQDLLKYQALGIYRLRILPESRFPKDSRGNIKFPPIAIEIINDRFCEMLNISREEFLNNIDVVREMVVDEEKDLFMKKNEEAYNGLKEFCWEGKFLINSTVRWLHFESIPKLLDKGETIWTGILYDISERKKREQEMQELIDILDSAVDEIHTLRGIVPICGNCKKVREDEGYWESVDAYISKHTHARFTHSICPDCAASHYSEFVDSDRPSN